MKSCEDPEVKNRKEKNPNPSLIQRVVSLLTEVFFQGVGSSLKYLWKSISPVLTSLKRGTTFFHVRGKSSKHTCHNDSSD